MLAREVSEYTKPSAGRDSMAPVKDRSRAPERLERNTIRNTRRATAAVSRPKRSFARFISVRARFTDSSVRDGRRSVNRTYPQLVQYLSQSTEAGDRTGETPLTFGDESSATGESKKHSRETSA